MVRIAYIGSFGRQYNTEVHIARDARALGHEVNCVEEADIIYGLKYGTRTSFVPDPDLVLYTKSIGLPPQASDWWRELEEAGARTAGVHLDLYRGLARQSEILDDPFWQTGDVFTADGDPNTQAELELLGVKHHWLPAAVVSDECAVAENPEQGGADVVFVGSTRGYHPEYGFRLELIHALQRTYGPRFQCFGPQEGQLVEGLALNRLYQRHGRIVVGDSLILPGHKNYWSNRYYETVGRGGFLIGPHVSGIDCHFRDLEHLRYYQAGDLPHLFDLIDYYLDHPDEARAIAANGQAHVRERHTYRNRVEAMLTTLGLA